MGASLHVSLPDEMRRFVDEISNGKSVYATPSEYVRALIRRDMEHMEAERSILRGYEEAMRGEFVDGEDAMATIMREIDEM
jgi:antitoxin ParD1/3/4